MQFPCLYYISRLSTAFSVKLIRLSAKTANILHLFTFPFYTITEPPDFCVKVYFCLIVPKFLWHYFWIAACAAVILWWLLPLFTPFTPPNSTFDKRDSTNCALTDKIHISGLCAGLPPHCVSSIIQQFCHPAWSHSPPWLLCPSLYIP